MTPTAPTSAGSRVQPSSQRQCSQGQKMLTAVVTKGTGAGEHRAQWHYGQPSVQCTSTVQYEGSMHVSNADAVARRSNK